MPATLQPYRTSISPTRTDHYPYVNSMGSSNDSYGGYGRQAAPTNSTSKNPNSMYSAMSVMLKEQHPILQNEQKTKKAAQSSPRPSTPHSNNKNKNFVERNKQLKKIPNKTTPVKKSREDSPPSSPTPGSKQKSSGSSGQSSTRSVTPHEKKSAVQPIKVDNKKKNDGVSSRTQSAHSRSHVRSTSPPTPTTPTAHSRSHVRATSPPASTANPTNSRSHVRAPSPESALRELRELREENRKLRRRLADQDDSLRERDSELLEYEDIVDAFQERVRQCEARNRELQQENELMRNYIEKVKSETSANEPTKLISSVMSNVQRIRGESTSPNPSTPSTPALSAISTSSAGVNSKSPSPIPPNSPALTILKSKELSKANNLNKVVAQARGNLVPVVKEVETSVEKKDHPPRPTAPSPAAMNRHEPSMYMETRDRQALGLMRKQTAALNAVMEESEDSDEVDEFVFEHDDASDDHADSEFDASSSESENEGEENDDDDDDGNGMTDDHHNDDTENEDDDVHGGDEEPVNTGFNLGNKHNLGAIVEEEDDDDEDDEFECFPPQNLKNRFPVNSAEPLKSSHRRVDRRLRVDSNDSSDSGIGSAHEEMSEVPNLSGQNGQMVNNGQSVNSSSSRRQLLKVNSTQKQQRSPPPHQEYFSSGQHRDSMSSVNSDSSDDSTTFSSQNNSYSSTATTPPSTQSLKQNLASSNGLYGQSSSAVSDVSSSKMMVSNTFKTSSAQSNNNENSLQQSVNSAFNNVKNLVTSQRSSSPNLKQSHPVNLRSTSPTSASSSRASTPNSNASTARATSPTSSNSSRSSTPSESSRNASGYKSRANETYENSNKCSTAIPPPVPPPPPTNDKEPFATLQHYLRLISENSIVEDPLKSFDIKKVIDEGSSAKVYNAHPLSNPEEECAIKIVPLSYSLEFIFNEIYVLKNLKHKNIVDCKESFLRWDGKTREVWIAMEKCARGDVTSRAGKISQREVGRIAGELLSALKHLHSHGIIHRDIKLSNILATANNEIKLADFGISSLTPTSTTAMVGTIPYMAPDVVLVGADRPYDTKVDIWAVGVCILELLTGKAAWGRIRDDEIMDKLRRGEMPYGFHRLRKKADIGWEAIDFLEKCFARTPENRWSAEKLLEHPFITGNRN